MIQLDDLQPTDSKPGVLRARLQYLDAIIASGATDREVEVKIEPPEPVAKVEEPQLPAESTSRDVGQGMDVDVDQDKPKVEDVKAERDADIEIKPPVQPERAASPIAPWVSTSPVWRCGR